ncbi:putative membrane protein [Blastococcus aggregatus]|uniref:Putative membrane protein n=2 Tax=Blastococcus aggregatus TaxID=38502 RepID=A0A285V4U1_9ACTN|nr:putative membrane protein [Blastococcus aggregatus]
MDMGMGWMWLFWLLLIIGVALLAVVAVRAAGGGVTRGGGREVPREQSRARQVLDERYARGEISTEEYQERLRVLGGDA